jgi:hypothetical protein
LQPHVLDEIVYKATYRRSRLITYSIDVSDYIVIDSEQLFFLSIPFRCLPWLFFPCPSHCHAVSLPALFLKCTSTPPSREVLLMEGEFAGRVIIPIDPCRKSAVNVFTMDLNSVRPSETSLGADWTLIKPERVKWFSLSCPFLVGGASPGVSVGQSILLRVRIDGRSCRHDPCMSLVVCHVCKGV